MPIDPLSKFVSPFGLMIDMPRFPFLGIPYTFGPSLDCSMVHSQASITSGKKCFHRLDLRTPASKKFSERKKKNKKNVDGSGT
jgi:hypothetical protein